MRFLFLIVVFVIRATQQQDRKLHMHGKLLPKAGFVVGIGGSPIIVAAAAA